MKKLLLLLVSSLAWGQGLPISQRPPAILPLTGTEKVPLVQGGANVQTAVSNLPGSGSSTHCNIAFTGSALFTITGSPIGSNCTGTVNFGYTGTGAFTAPLKGNGSGGFSLATAADIYGLWSGTCNNTTFLRGDGSCQSVAGSGTVTSVGIIMPPMFTVSGTPITTAGTFTISYSGVPAPPGAGGTGSTGITGLVKGNGSSPMTAATSADVIADWTGTCNGTTYLRADGQCQPGGAPSLSAFNIFANPTGSTTTGISVPLGNNISLASGSLSGSQNVVLHTGNYSIASGDAGNQLQFCSVSPIAVTIPVGTSAGFTSGFAVDIQNGNNIASACTGTGAVTVTPTSGTIGGLASLVIPFNSSCEITSNSTSDWQLFACSAIQASQASTLNLVNLSVAGAAPPAASNTVVRFTGTLSGTGSFAGTPFRYAPFWANYADTAAFPNTGVGNTGLAFVHDDYVHLETGWDGFRGGNEIQIKVNAPPATVCVVGTTPSACSAGGATVVSTNINMQHLIASVSANMGGIGGSYGGGNGNIFDDNPSVTATTNGTWLALMNNEFDVNNTAFTGPPVEKHNFAGSLTGICSPQPCSSEQPALWDDSFMESTTGDNFGTSYWHILFKTGSFGHANTVNYSSSFIEPERRYAGGTAQYAQPTFRYGIHFNSSDFSLASTTSTGAITSISTSAGSGLACANFGALGSAPAIGGIITISGATPVASGWNGGYVIAQSTTTTACFITGNLASYNASSGTGSITTPAGASYDSPGFKVDDNGVVTASQVNVGASGLVSQTATVSSITVDPQPFGGYVGGAYFASATEPSFNIATPNGAVAPTVGAHPFAYQLNAALLMTSATSFVGSMAPTAANPNGASVATGCSASETLTITGGTFSTAAQVLVTASGGVVTSAKITVPGAYTVKPNASPGYTTTGTCSATLNTWMQLGFGITGVTLTGNGSGYSCVSPDVWLGGFGTTINTPAKLIANMSCTSQPVVMAQGSSTGGTVFADPTLTNCSGVSSKVGGATAGSFVVTTGNAACMVQYTGLPAQLHGNVCHIVDQTTHTMLVQSANSTTSCSGIGATSNSDVIVFSVLQGY